jgi:hypothetical protein
MQSVSLLFTPAWYALLYMGLFLCKLVKLQNISHENYQGFFIKSERLKLYILLADNHTVTVSSNTCAIPFEAHSLLQ